MSLKRCEKGHFYDSDKYRQCPFCDKGIRDEMLDGICAGYVTDDVIFKNQGVDEAGDTVIPLANYTVGWLMAIDGPHKGQDYPLRTGRNTIGRDVSMDVPLHFDNAAARQKHAIVIFDPVSQMTLCQAGESRELFYLNGKVVTDTVELQKGDVLTIGRTKLMFVPFCGELHTWEEK